MALAELFLYLVLTLAALVLVLTLVWAAVRELISLGVERREASRLGWVPVDLPMPAPVSDWGTPEAERAMWRRLAVHRAHPWTPGERGWPSTCRRCRTGCSSPRNVADGRWSLTPHALTRRVPA